MNTIPIPHYSTSKSNGSMKSKEEEARVAMPTSPSGLSATKQKDTIVAVENPEKGCYFSRTQVAAFMIAFLLTMCVVVILVTCFGNNSNPGHGVDRGFGDLDLECDCNEPFLAHSVTQIDDVNDLSHDVITEIETVTSNSDADGLGIRLPGDIIPEHYDIDLNLKIEGEYSRYAGSVKMHVNIIRNTSLVVFHVKPYNILEVFREEVYIYRPEDYISDKDLDKISVPIVSYYKDAHKEIHVARLKETLPEGTKYIIFIRKFHGIMIGDLKGLYTSSYKDKNGEKR